MAGAFARFLLAIKV